MQLDVLYFMRACGGSFMVANTRRSTGKKVSYADYQQWPDDERFEIIDGQVYPMNAPLRIHQEILLEMARQFANFLRGKPCKIYVAPFDVRFTDRPGNEDEIFDVVQPDLSVVCDHKKLDDKGCLGAPDLIVEIISPSSASYDNIKKRALYEKFGVKEFWLVHPTDRLVTAYRLIDGAYGRPEIFDIFNSASPSLFPDLKIDLCEVFGISPAEFALKEDKVPWRTEIVERPPQKATPDKKSPTKAARSKTTSKRS